MKIFGEGVSEWIKEIKCTEEKNELMDLIWSKNSWERDIVYEIRWVIKENAWEIRRILIFFNLSVFQIGSHYNFSLIQTSKTLLRTYWDSSEASSSGIRFIIIAQHPKEEIQT